ncbi:MAG: hypothetical protein V1861_06045, partial [Candidatus Micrarchaeota archaeon]
MQQEISSHELPQELGDVKPVEKAPLLIPSKFLQRSRKPRALALGDSHPNLYRHVQKNTFIIF